MAEKSSHETASSAIQSLSYLLSSIPGNPNNYIKTQCFALPTLPTSFSAQCATFQGAAAPAPSGSVYCSNLRGNAGRNILTGPGLSEFDFSLFKNNYIRRISENFNVQFRAELFNLLNRGELRTATDSG